jgi:sporulation integral membrane protein YlbJ
LLLSSRLNKREITGLFWTAGAVIFVIMLVRFPQAVYLASHRGLKAWWEIVFPALLPFFIGTEMLMGFGVVRFMGVLMEPIMRPLFNLPGAASFVVAIGFTSGFPIGSIVTTNLRKDGLVTKTEGERLFSFTNNASPLFMLAAVAVGMYQSPYLGLVLAGSHYGANLTLGLLMGLFSKLWRNRWTSQVRADYSQPLKQILRRAFRELGVFHRDNCQPLGQRLSIAISKSINTLLMIGGFIIIFSVLIEVFSKLGLLGFFAYLLAIVLTNLGLDPQLAPALATGIFEITLGTKLAAETAAPLPEKMLVTSFLLAWSGISVHAQVAGIISGTDLRYWPFFLCRLAHALLAVGYSLLLYKPITALLETANIPVWGSLTTKFGGVLPWWYQFKLFSWLFIWDCGFLGLVALLLLTLKKLKSFRYNS